MSRHYDVIVIGVGGMGSATVYELARRGKKVLGLEQFDIPHSMGSSHGVNRIIRLAYFEHPNYVSLLRRAYELWREVQTKAGEQLLYITGGLDISRPDDDVFRGSVLSCELHSLPHEILDARTLMARFPAFHVPVDMQANFQPDAGFLLSERCIVNYVWQAQALGAEVHAREKVVEWQPTSGGVRVRTDRGTYEADKLVVTAGAWAGKLLEPLQGGLAIPERQALAWFQPRQPELFQMGRFPVFIMSTGDSHFYGFPVFSVPGFKIGRMHHRHQTVDPDTTMDRECYPEDEKVLRDFVEQYVPEAAGSTMALKTCMFTNSPDEHFILDIHPEYSQVVFAAGFSGHGFKFCSVIGEVMAELALQGQTRHDIGFLRLGRLSRTFHTTN